MLADARVSWGPLARVVGLFLGTLWVFPLAFQGKKTGPWTFNLADANVGAAGRGSRTLGASRMARPTAGSSWRPAPPILALIPRAALGKEGSVMFSNRSKLFVLAAAAVAAVGLGSAPALAGGYSGG